MGVPAGIDPSMDGAFIWSNGPSFKHVAHTKSLVVYYK